MEYDHKCICGHREKDHAPAGSAEQSGPCSVCDCGGFRATNVISSEKSEA